MKKQMKLMMVLAVCATGIAQASMDPDWAGDHGSVYAVWDNWAAFGAGSASVADYYEAFDPETGAQMPNVNGLDAPDVLSSHATREFDGVGNNWLSLNASDDLSFWMPSFSGYETQETVIQLSYWDDQGNPGWRAGLDLNIQLYDNSGAGSFIAGPLTYLGEEVNAGLITEAWSFTVNNSADGFFADFTVDEADISGGGVFVEQVSIDTISYDAIPEPASVVSMVFGGVILAGIRKRIRN